MRMFGPDLVLFVVGALMLGGATYGLIVTPHTGTAGGDSNVGLYKVSWKEVTNTSDGGELVEGATLDEKTNVSGTNLAKLVFSIDCRDGNPGAGQNPYRYTFELHMAPEGIETPEPQANIACGRVTEIEVPLTNATFAEQQIRAASLEAATADAGKLGNSTGSGEYHFKITGARGQPIPTQLPVPRATITVTVTVVSYTPQVEAVVATPK